MDTFLFFVILSGIEGNIEICILLLVEENMNNNFVKIALVVLGFALTFFLSCADNDDPPYPDINHFLSSSSRPSSPSLTPSSSSISIPVSSFVLSSSSIASSSSSRPSSSSKPSSSSSTPSSSSSSVLPSSSSIVWSDDTFTGNSGTFTDFRDKMTYKWVKIDTQIWMAENLNYDKDNSYFVNESCGRLYTWLDAMALTEDCGFCPNLENGQRKGICPNGWHLPNKTEWEALISHVGNSAQKLKSKDGWNSNTTGVPNNGDDDYGFTARPCGVCEDPYEKVSYYGNQGSWWTSALDGARSYYAAMYFDFATIDIKSSSKNIKHSVRCIKDN